MQTSYPAFLIGEDGRYTVVFPDLPGCLTYADSPSDAFIAAQGALNAHLLAMKKSDMIVPLPSDLLSVRPDDEDAPKVVSTLLIPATIPGKTVRTNITIDEGLLVLVDGIASNRSAFFAEAAWNELSRRRNFETASHPPPPMTGGRHGNANIS
jgi:predicted RNase H-like HicB family nuclease